MAYQAPTGEYFNPEYLKMAVDAPVANPLKFAELNRQRQIQDLQLQRLQDEAAMSPLERQLKQLSVQDALKKQQDQDAAAAAWKANATSSDPVAQMKAAYDFHMSQGNVQAANVIMDNMRQYVAQQQQAEEFKTKHEETKQKMQQKADLDHKNSVLRIAQGEMRSGIPERQQAALKLVASVMPEVDLQTIADAVASPHNSEVVNIDGMNYIKTFNPRTGSWDLKGGPQYNYQLKSGQINGQPAFQNYNPRTGNISGVGGQPGAIPITDAANAPTLGTEPPMGVTTAPINPANLQTGTQTLYSEPQGIGGQMQGMVDAGANPVQSLLRGFMQNNPQMLQQISPEQAAVMAKVAGVEPGATPEPTLPKTAIQVPDNTFRPMAKGAEATPTQAMKKQLEKDANYQFRVQQDYEPMMKHINEVETKAKQTLKLDTANAAETQIQLLESTLDDMIKSGATEFSAELAMVKWAKILDPESVVRESEVGRYKAARNAYLALQKMAASYEDKRANNIAFTPDDAKRMQQAVQRLHKAYYDAWESSPKVKALKKSLDPIKKRYQDAWNEYGADASVTSLINPFTLPSELPQATTPLGDGSTLKQRLGE